MKKNYVFATDIFENRTYEEMRKDYASFLSDNGLENKSFSDDEMYNFFYEDIEFMYDDFKSEIQSQDKVYLVAANVGRWNGRFKGFRIVRGLSKVIEIITEKEDDFEVYFEGCTLHVDTHNHDASSYMEIYELTDKGERYYDLHDNYFYESEYETAQHLMDVKCYRKNVLDWRK